MDTNNLNINKPNSESTLFVNSVERAMRVLKVFTDKAPQLSLSQIAERANLNISATQRFTYTLQELGYLVRDPLSKAFSLSPRMLDFAYCYLSSDELVNRATPYLRQLSQETSETVNITVLDGSDIVFTLRIVSQHVLTPHVVTGSRLPAYCTAPGIAILAKLPLEEAKYVLNNTCLRQYTPHTVYDYDKILARLAKVRENGYAYAKSEYYLGDISIAAPICNAAGYPIGALNVATSSSRWKGDEDEKRISDLVIATASAITGQF